MDKKERNKDLCNVSPHMDTIRGYKLTKIMNGMTRSYWQLMTVIILAGLLAYAAAVIALAVSFGG